MSTGVELSGLGLPAPVAPAAAVAARLDRRGMETLARILGFAEFLLVPFSLLWLLVALRWRSRRRSRRAVALALILALTVAQPFGVVATDRAAPPRDAHRVSSTSVHVARLFGVLPVLPFALYHQDNLYSGENEPTAKLKARSWFWLPILTNATTVTAICGSDSPCWPIGRDSRALQLSQRGGNYYATLLDRGTGQLPPLAGRMTWDLSAGIVSLSGLVYWILLALLLPRVRRAGRKATG